MLGKDKRICPRCGERLHLRPRGQFEKSPPDCSFRGYGDNGYVRTRATFAPYTVNPHRDYNIGSAKQRARMKIAFLSEKEKLKYDGLFLFDYRLIFFCDKCGGRLSLNFNPLVLDNIWFVSLIVCVPLFIMALIYPPLWLRWWVFVPIGVFAAFNLFLGLCLLYTKLFLSNFVPVDDYDGLKIVQKQISIPCGGLKSAYLHKSNILSAELDGRQYHFYIVEKAKDELHCHICGANNEAERLITSIGKQPDIPVRLEFEGKTVGTAKLTYSED